MQKLTKISKNAIKSGKVLIPNKRALVLAPKKETNISSKGDGGSRKRNASGQKFVTGGTAKVRRVQTPEESDEDEDENDDNEEEESEVSAEEEESSVESEDEKDEAEAESDDNEGQVMANESDEASEGQQSDQEDNNSDHGDLNENSNDSIKAAAELDYHLNLADINSMVAVENFSLNIPRDQVRALFEQFGAIKAIKFQFRKWENTKISLKVFVVFKKQQSAINALRLNGTRHGTQALIVRKPKAEEIEDHACKVVVKFMHLDVTEDAVREHFEATCGDINSIKIIKDQRKRESSAVITFVREESVRSSFKLHWSLLNDCKIGVFRYMPDYNIAPILVRNFPQNLSEKEIRSFFSPCGQIDALMRDPAGILIFYKQPEGVKRALQLNNQSFEGQPIHIGKYQKKTGKGKPSLKSKQKRRGPKPKGPKGVLTAFEQKMLQQISQKLGGLPQGMQGPGQGRNKKAKQAK